MTTNPKLLNEAQTTASELFIETGPDSHYKLEKFFFQVRFNEEVDEFDQKTKSFYRKDHLPIIKIPMVNNEWFLRDDSNLLKNYTKCGTMIYDIAQLFQACVMGFEYSIVINAKNPDENFLEKAVEFRNKHGYTTRLIAASFRTKSDVIRASKILSDGDFMTIPPQIMKSAFNSLEAKSEYLDIYENFSSRIS